MAIPGTPEYHREYMNKKRAAEAAAPARRTATIDPKAVGLDVDFVEPSGAPVSLARRSLDATPISSDVVVSDGPAPKEPKSGPDSGIRIKSGGGGKKAEMRDAAIASMQARGLPPPPTGQEIATAEAAQANAYEREAVDRLGLQGAQTVSSAPNVDYGLTKRYVDTSTALNESAYDAQLAIDEAEMLRANKVADFMDEQNARQAEAVTDMRARQFVQEEAAMEAQERTKQAYGLVSQATEKLMSAPDVDPGRWWASRSDGQKVAAFFGMLGRGMGGGNPSDFLNERIDRDIDAQKATFAQGAAAAGAAREQGNMARGLYEDIRAKTQDEREADAIYAVAKAEQMKAQFDAFATRSAIPSVMAQQQQNRLAIEQMVADRRMTLEKVAAHNAQRRTVVSKAYRAVRDPATGQVYRVPVGGPGDVALAKYALEEASKGRGDARKLLGDTVTEGIKAGAKSEEAERAERQFQYQQRKDQAGGEKGAAVETALQLANDWMTDYGENVPDRTEGGIGGTAYLSAPKWLSSKEGRRELSRRQNIGHWFATALTGATVSEAQKEFVDGLVAGENMSGDDLRMGIADLTRTLQIYQSTYQRSAEEAAQAGYRGVDEGELPTRDPKTGGMKRSNTGVDAEAAHLGGTLR